MEILSRLIQLVRASLSSGTEFAPGHPGEKSWRTSSGEKGGKENATGGRNRENQRYIDPQLATYFANLEIPYGSDLETAKKAWKSLVKKYHPDLHSSDPLKQKTANELVQGINKAFEEIRKHYQEKSGKS
ncbi:MAG: DnaJ family molecular chaperone [Calditrichia bacterium]